MKKISSKLNIYRGKVNIVNNNIQKLFFNIIFFSFIGLAFLYVLFLGRMVHNVIERRSLEASIRTLSNEVRDLELTYLSMSNNIDLAFSHSLGFKESKTIFATRKSLSYGSLGDNFGLDQNDRVIAQNDL